MSHLAGGNHARMRHASLDLLHDAIGGAELAIEVVRDAAARILHENDPRRVAARRCARHEERRVALRQPFARLAARRDARAGGRPCARSSRSASAPIHIRPAYASRIDGSIFAVVGSGGMSAVGHAEQQPAAVAAHVRLDLPLVDGRRLPADWRRAGRRARADCGSHSRSALRPARTQATGARGSLRGSRRCAATCRIFTGSATRRHRSQRTSTLSTFSSRIVPEPWRTSQRSNSGCCWIVTL